MADPLHTVGHDPAVAAPETDPNATSVRMPITPDPDLSIPPVTARYVLGNEIARGGMGAVLHATDTVLRREVAVKVLLDKYGAASDAARRFADEARITAQLQHPAIPPVHDLGTLPDGRPFLAMKLVKGRTLDALLSARDEPSGAGGLSPPAPPRGRFVAVFEQIAQGVAFAHSRRIIHRNIKPANVMVGDFGEVQVMDWGLAKELGATSANEPVPVGPAHEPGAMASPDQTTGLEHSDKSTEARTEVGQVMGTPAYMPPEQARGEPVDCRADVFALGGILCAILTGKPPFAGRGAEAIQKAAAGDLSGTFERLDVCGADGELVALCKRCLNAIPANRPPDAGEVSRLVAAYRTGVEQRLRAVERERAAAEAKAVEQRKRRKVQLLLGAAFMLIVCGGVAFGWWRNDQKNAQRIEQENREREERNRNAQNATAVSVVLDGCAEALRAGDAAKAAVLLDAAQNQANAGGAETLAGRMERYRADLTLLRALDAIDRFRWTPDGNNFPSNKRVAERFRVALRDFGLNPDVTPADEAARRVTDSEVRLTAALDRLILLESSAWARAVLRAADPDAYRDAVRDAVLMGNKTRIGELANRPEVAAQLPEFVTILVESVPDGLKQREMLEAAVQRRPNNLGLLMALGNTYPISQREGANERVVWYQAAVAVAPENPAPHLNLGVARADLKEFATAETEYRKALELEPNHAVAHTNLGNLRANRKDYAGALVEYRLALKLEPTHAVTHFNLGFALKRKGDIDDAMKAIQEALNLDPELAIAHNELGLILEERKDFDGAFKEYQKAVKLDPKLAFARVNLGNSLFNQRDYLGALVQYKEAVRLDKEYAPAHMHYGNGLNATGDPKGAIAAYREAIRLDPDYPHAYTGLGSALSATGDVPGAVVAFREALRIDPNHGPAHNNLGNALLKQKDYAGAIAAYKEVLRIAPQFIAVHINIGLAHDANGDKNKAIASYQEYLRHDPKNAEMHNHLAIALNKNGDLDGAIVEFREATHLAPMNPQFSQNLTLALKLQADRESRVAPPPREVK